MTRTAARWRVRLAASAEADYRQVVRWTTDRFGARQADIYARTIRIAIRALVRGPTIIGVRRRDDVGPGLYSLHVARGGRKGRHLLLLRIDDGDAAIEVLRLLHDAMDLPQQIERSGPT